MERISQEFPSDVRQLAAVRALVRNACRRAWGAELNEADLAQLELAVGEAAANVILHAYAGQAGRPLEVVVAVERDRVRVSLFHEGQPFDPGQVPPPSFDGSRESGFGLYLIRQAVDELVYFQDERGRHGVTMLKKTTAPAPLHPAATGAASAGDLHELPRRADMQTAVEQVGDVTIVTINEEQLDAGNADDFRHDIGAILRDCRKLVIDLARVRFVDSRGCGAILFCLKQLSGNNGDLKLCNVSPYVRTVFDLIRLHRICEILPSREAALKAFQ